MTEVGRGETSTDSNSREGQRTGRIPRREKETQKKRSTNTTGIFPTDPQVDRRSTSREKGKEEQEEAIVQGDEELTEDVERKERRIKGCTLSEPS
jgi:CRISPR/Cas system-associated endonuclease/helicase Cas3